MDKNVTRKIPKGKLWRQWNFQGSFIVDRVERSRNLGENGHQPMFTKDALLACMYINITSLRIYCAIHYIKQLFVWLVLIFSWLVIRAQAGYGPFPQQAPSDCASTFNDRQYLLNTIGVLVNNSWSRHVNGLPDVGRCYEIGSLKRDN